MEWAPADLLETLDEAVSVIDRDLRWVYCNPASERLTGVSRAGLAGKHVLETFPDAEGTEIYAALNRALATGETQRVETYYPPLDRWFGGQIYVIGDYLHVITRDITELKLAETRLLMLSRAAETFARALELEPLCDAIAQSFAELIGDACIVRIVDGDQLRPVAVHHADPQRRDALVEFFAQPLAVNEGLSARVLKTGEPLLIDRVEMSELRDTFADADHRTRIQRSPIHSTAAVALSNGTERIGVLTVLRDCTRRAFTRADVALLVDIADRASVAFTRARQYGQAQHERRRAALLSTTARAFSAAEGDLDTVLDLLTRTVASEVGDLVVASIVRDSDGTVKRVLYHHDPAIVASARAMVPSEAPAPGTIAEQIVASALPLRISNAELDGFITRHAMYAHIVRALGLKSLMFVPLTRGGRVLGSISVARIASLAPFTDDDQQLVHELGDRAALAIESGLALEAEKRARQAAERVAEQTRYLHAIGAQLTDRRTPREVAETILRESTNVLRGSNAAIWLLEGAGTLRMLASIGFPSSRRFDALPLDAEVPLSAAVRTEQALYLEDIDTYRAQFPTSIQRLGDTAPAQLSAACLPLISEGRAIGGLAFGFPFARTFVPDERSFLGVLASQCANAIDRSRLLEQERIATVALAETNRTLNAVIHASPAAIVICDLHGVIRLWNPAAERIFGWTAGEILGKRWPALDESMQPEFFANLQRISHGEEIRGFETRRLRRDGSQIDVALWAAPVQRPDGQTQALAVFVDITDRKIAEEAARLADQRKDEFLAMLGHELRNPLAPILTALELMRLHDVIGGERERGTIERQTRHLVRLVDDLLDISRITRGKIELRKDRVDLGIAIAQGVEMASPLLEQRSHQVSIAAPRGLVFVDGDEFRLAQVFQNLLTNAAKYTPSGGSITVRLRMDAGNAIADIEDNGVGITADVLPTIFDPFVQGAQKLDRSHGGLGIGLTLVRSLTELHGGHVDAYSAGAGHGSRFTVRIPVSAGKLRDVQRTPDGMAPLRAARRRVLLVDDNRDAAEMLAELLRAAGHEVVVAFDGPSALGTLPGFNPEVALLDIGLPVMDGYDLARKLKAALPASPRLVAITGYGQEHDHRRSLEAGFDAHLVKPVQAAQVLAAVDDTSS